MSSPSPSFSCIPKLLASALVAAMVFYLLNPAFYWQLARTAVHGSRSGGCSPCLCDCVLEASEESMLLPGVSNSRPSGGCIEEARGGGGGGRAEGAEEELVREELKLQGSVAARAQRESDMALLEAKKLVSQYQKEAEKCSSGMETCEAARQRSEEALSAQKRISAIWERRARELGWRDPHHHQANPRSSSSSSFFDRIGLSGLDSNHLPADSFLFRRSRRSRRRRARA